MNIVDFLDMQRMLQIKMKEANPTQGGDPYEMTEEELAVFITWNHTALIKELGEALDECGWKPWASSRHIDGGAAIHEMVDAWHFFLNMMLGFAAWSQRFDGQRVTTTYIAKFFEDYYVQKNRKNLQRQVEGYDGVSTKCPVCKRDLAEVSGTVKVTVGNVTWCSVNCYYKSPTGKEEEMSMHNPEAVSELQQKIEAQSDALPPTETAEEVTERVAREHEAKQAELTPDQMAEMKEKHRQKVEAERMASMAAQDYTPDPPKTPAQQALGDLPEVQQVIQFPGSIEGNEYSGKAASILQKCKDTGEPIFIFRAKDIFSVQVLVNYLDIIEKYGPSSYEMQEEIGEQIQAFKDWQKANSDKVRFPD